MKKTTLLFIIYGCFVVLNTCTMNNPHPAGTPEAQGYQFGYIIFAPALASLAVWSLIMLIWAMIKFVRRQFAEGSKPQ